MSKHPTACLLLSKVFFYVPKAHTQCIQKRRSRTASRLKVNDLFDEQMTRLASGSAAFRAAGASSAENDTSKKKGQNGSSSAERKRLETNMTRFNLSWP